MGNQAEHLSKIIVTRNTEAKESHPEPGLTRSELARNDKLLLVEDKMKKGWVGIVHSHPHDQPLYIVHGHLKVECEGRTFDVQTGDSYAVRSGVEHTASAVEDSLVIEVLTPRRDERIS
jgi:quercetin dioxygenase-like cupin family protein